MSEKITLEIEKECLQDEYEIEYKLAHLLIEGEIFCNNGWWYKEEGINWPEDHVSLHVNCNDVFYWACADAERITNKEIHELYEMWSKDNRWGTAAWCIKKRKQMPQPPVAKRMIEAGYNLEDLIK